MTFVSRFLFIKLPLWVHTGTYEDDNTKHNNIQKNYNQQHGAAAETAPGQFLQMRNHRLVPGGPFYVSGIDHEARLEADGEDVPFDVPYLRMRSASGTDRQMDRRLAQSGEITERKKVGSGDPPRYALHGPDICGGIRIRSVASVTGNVSLGLHGTEYEYRRPHTARFCSAVVRHRAFI